MVCRVLATRSGGDDDRGTLFGQAFSKVVGVIAAIGQQGPEAPCVVHQGMGHGDVVAVSRADEQDSRPSEFVHQAMDLGGSPASRQPYALEEGPPFAPAAERWALTEVESIAAEE